MSYQNAIEYCHKPPVIPKEISKFYPTENLDTGEVLIIQFTATTSAIKIRGKAEIYTQFGIIYSEEKQEEFVKIGKMTT